MPSVEPSSTATSARSRKLWRRMETAAARTVPAASRAGRRTATRGTGAATLVVAADGGRRLVGLDVVRRAPRPARVGVVLAEDRIGGLAAEPDRGVVVAGRSEAHDLPAGGRGDEVLAAPLLAGVDVGDVHLDHREGDRLQAVVQRVARVGEGAGVDDEAAGLLAVLLDEVDEGALVVRLEAPHLAPVGRAGLGDHASRCRGAWWRRRPPARARRAGSGSVRSRAGSSRPPDLPRRLPDRGGVGDDVPLYRPAAGAGESAAPRAAPPRCASCRGP